MRHTDRTFTLAAAGGIAAALLFAVTLVRALTVDPSPDADTAHPTVPAAASMDAVPPSQENAREVTATESAAPIVREGDVAAAAGPPLSLDALRLAVENDPFQESRQRPPERYRMPGDAIESEGPPPPPPPPPFQVLGIAQSAGGGIAVMQIEDTPPRVLAVGESLFGYTLERVEGEVATLSGQGRTLTLTVAQASPNPVVEEEARSSRRGRARDADEAIERLRNRRNGDEITVDQVREMQQNAVEMIRRMMEQQQQRGNNRGGNDGSSVVFSPWVVDGNRTVGIPNQRGRVILRADTNLSVLPPAPIRR